MTWPPNPHTMGFPASRAATSALMTARNESPARIFGSEFDDFRRRRATDDGKGDLRTVLPNQGEDFADKKTYAIHVGEPVHGADEDEIHGGGRGRGWGEEVFDVDAGRDFGDAGDVK